MTVIRGISHNCRSIALLTDRGISKISGSTSFSRGYKRDIFTVLKKGIYLVVEKGRCVCVKCVGKLAGAGAGPFTYGHIIFGALLPS